MVQYVIDCLSWNTAPPCLESADAAVSFTFRWKRLIQRPGSGCRFQVRGMSVVQDTSFPVKSLAFLLGLDMLREFGLVIKIAHCYSTKLWCRIPVTVLPSGHLALALTPSGNFETTGETTTLVKEIDADMTAAVQDDLLE